MPTGTWDFETADRDLLLLAGTWVLVFAGRDLMILVETSDLVFAERVLTTLVETSDLVFAERVLKTLVETSDLVFAERVLKTLVETSDLVFAERVLKTHAGTLLLGSASVVYTRSLACPLCRHPALVLQHGNTETGHRGWPTEMEQVLVRVEQSSTAGCWGAGGTWPA